MVLWWEIQEGNKGEAISSRGGFASLYKSGSMRSFPDTQGKYREREREGEVIRIPNWLPGTKFKVSQIWAL
jgi:hypothetical protein